MAYVLNILIVWPLRNCATILQTFKGEFNPVIIVTTNSFNICEIEADEVVTIGPYLHVRSESELVAIFRIYVEIVED